MCDSPNFKPRTAFFFFGVAIILAVAVVINLFFPDPAGPHDPINPPASPDLSFVVTVRKNMPQLELKIRAGPNKGDPLLGGLRAGEQSQANCWTTGERVIEENVDNGIWIKLDSSVLSPESPDGYVWAGGLEGDKYANVSIECR